MATLKKMTRMGADVRQIARLLQAKAPEGHMLAYITPEEAELLKSQGGSGKPHADTGVPSFENESYDMYGETATPTYSQPVSQPQASVTDLPPAQDSAAPAQTQATAPAFNSAQPMASFDASQFAPESSQVSVASRPELAQQPISLSPAMTMAGADTVAGIPELRGAETQQQGKSLTDKAEDVTKFLDKNASLVRLLGLGATGVGGLLRGRQGARQAESLRNELGTLGQDYRRQGQELLTKAQSGELTAPQQQQLQAAQAQLAQQATARGGVGSMQAATQIEALRQQYVAQNMDRALQLLGIADQYQANAIKAGYSASKDAQAAADKFYGAMGQFLVPQSQQTTPRN